MMTALVNFFLPDSLPQNSAQRRKARLTLAITFLIIGACLAYTGAHYRWEFWSGIPVLLGSAALLTGVPIALRQGAAPSLMAKATAVVMLGLITLLTIRSGGTASTSAPWFMVAPLIGLLLAEQWFAILLTAVSIAELSIIYALELSGHAFPTPMPDSMAGESLFFSYVGLITVVLLTARVFKQEQSQALRKAESAAEDAKAQKQETEEMARQLETQKASVERRVEEATHELQEQKDALARHATEMLDAMTRFADGDLSVRVDTDRDDEIGDLFDGFNRAVESVRQTLLSVRDAAAETARTTEEISASSEQMATAAEEQSAQAEEVAAAVEQMNQTISENARSVQRAAEATRDAAQQAERSGEIVAEATQQIHQIAEVAQTTAETIQGVGDSSAEIIQIVDAIDEIAGQTNLLALNAAIEAARAGDEGGGQTGQGFAVVAEEVRALAEDADAATTKIEHRVQGATEDIEDAVGAARQSSQRAQTGLELAGEADDALDEVTAAIDRAQRKADEIAAASEEQSTTSDEIARSVQSISTAARESAAGVVQVSSSATDLEKTVQRLRESVAEFELEQDPQSESSPSAPPSHSATNRDHPPSPDTHADLPPPAMRPGTD
ncbi:methyl-accepting chemotaxis protein [Salinibacter altiplanensis]|uniref:methyl-accepting chemotaxis protein n=1 Tax=Salinibacter altiplanensis TaxID=1803181 RepID=UPI001F1CDBB9|nr:methyl-accepting chemotaxis protein [Salinibacter altiplanensis]